MEGRPRRIPKLVDAHSPHAPGEPLEIVAISAGQIGGHRISDGKRTFSRSGASPVIVASPILDGNTVLAFGYGYASVRPFAGTLAQKDLNKDGKVNRDEYKEADTALSAIGRTSATATARSPKMSGSGGASSSAEPPVWCHGSGLAETRTAVAGRQGI